MHTINMKTAKQLWFVNRNVHYINRQGQEQYMTMREYPSELEKKMKLLTYFRRYMTEHLMKAGMYNANARMYLL